MREHTEIRREWYTFTSLSKAEADLVWALAGFYKRQQRGIAGAAPAWGAEEDPERQRGRWGAPAGAVNRQELIGDGNRTNFP